ncbi:MAG: methionyl-tRNA formyltransferase [Muribaculaceae bacterium]|nr:methionyl-tRNA formyltransferase [Muribaculaceae bacterium]
MEKKDLRIVFLGTPDFAVESLRRIVDEGYNVVGVVTMPDKPAGRGHRMYQSPVKEFALDRGLKLMQPVSLKDPEFVGELRSLDADLFVVIAFRMLPEVVWTMPRLGTFNLHASLLPRYRGAAPINWAVINGDRETGVTTFFLKHEIDTGDILRQERIEIGEDENVGSVHDRLMALGAELTLDTIGHIIAGDLVPRSQDAMPGGEAPTLAPKIFRDTCHIDFGQPAERVRNLIRGLSPYPAAWCELRDASEPGAGQAPLSTLKVYESKRAGETALAPGEVSVADGRMLVGCGDGNALELVEVQPSGKRRMTAGEFLRGARLPQRLVMG